MYNKALEWRIEQYRADKDFRTNHFTMCKLLPQWKKEFPWLKACVAQGLQKSLKDLDQAFKNFFAGRSNFPKFKKRGVRDSITFPQGFKVEQHNSRVYLPKIGWVRYRNSRRVEGKMKSVTITVKCGKYFVSVLTEQELIQPIPKGGEVGVDLGIVRFATLSDGTYFEPLSSFKKSKAQLAKLQRQLKNKVKFSNNWRKQKDKIAKLHHRIANRRKDHLHKVSSHISKNHAIVYVEDLKVSNMSKSAKGDSLCHGKQVKQKSGLNRAILDQGWYEFRRQIGYKLTWQGGSLVAVPAKNTSRRCLSCGYISGDNRITQDSFRCAACGFSEHADVVGAKNVLLRGQELMSKSGQGMSKELVK